MIPDKHAVDYSEAELRPALSVLKRFASSDVSSSFRSAFQDLENGSTPPDWEEALLGNSQEGGA